MRKEDRKDQMEQQRGRGGGRQEDAKGRKRREDRLIVGRWKALRAHLVRRKGKGKKKQN